jgi:hypothetical protein
MNVEWDDAGYPKLTIIAWVVQIDDVCHAIQHNGGIIVDAVVTW